MDILKKLTIGDRWVLRSDMNCEEPFKVINIDTGLVLNLSRALFILLKLFARNAISISDLIVFLEKNNIVTELDNFLSIVQEYSHLNLLQTSNSIQDRFFSTNTLKSDLEITDTPENVEIHFTHKCNLACRHCFQSSSPTSSKFHEISKTSWTQIFNNLEYYNVYNIILSGGEPLYYAEFNTLFSEIVYKRLRFNILTNGIGVNKDNCKLLSKPNVKLTISMDGYNSELHDFLRGKGAYAKLIQSIKLLLSVNAKINISYTIHRKNYKYIEEFIDFALGMKIKSVGFLLIDPLGRANNNSYLLFNYDEMNEITNSISKLKEKFKGKIHIEYTDPMSLNVGNEKSKIISCSAGTNRIAIDPNGIIYPCAMAFGEEELIIGNAVDDNLKEIWEKSAKWNLFRGGISVDEIEGCCNCKLKEACSLKNCRLKSYQESKNMYGKPIGCQYDRIQNESY